MKAPLILIVAASLAVASVPLASASHPCSLFQQSRTVAGATITVTISNCHSSVHGDGSNYRANVGAGHSQWGNNAGDCSQQV